MSHLPHLDEEMKDLLILGAVLLLMYISARITPITLESVITGDVFFGLFAFLQGKVDISIIRDVFLSLQNVFAVFGVVFLGGIFWTIIKTNEIHHSEHKKYEPIHEEKTAVKGLTVQWQVVVDHVESSNPAEWKLAILEADNMLDEVLEDQGYFGETLADKLKVMNPGRIASYDEVWEAHKLRNRIAHGGAIDMELTQKMARDTVAKFGNVFKELGYL